MGGSADHRGSYEALRAGDGSRGGQASASNEGNKPQWSGNSVTTADNRENSRDGVGAVGIDMVIYNSSSWASAALWLESQRTSSVQLIVLVETKLLPGDPVGRAAIRAATMGWKGVWVPALPSPSGHGLRSS